MIVFQILNGYIFSMVYIGGDKNNVFFFTTDMIKDKEFVKRLKENAIKDEIKEREIVRNTISSVENIFMNPHLRDYFIYDDDFKVIYDEFYKKYYLKKEIK